MNKLNNISPKIVHTYRKELEKGSTPATTKRKMSSLKRFFDWAQDKGHIETHPLPLTPKITPKPEVVPEAVIVQKTQEVKPKKSRIFVYTLRLGILGSMAVLIFLLLTQKVQLPIPFRKAPAQELAQETTTEPTPQPSPAPSITEELDSDTAITGAFSIDWASFEDGNLLIGGTEVLEITLSTANSSDGDITINPDGSGIAHFLFEGTSSNFLNAQAPNLIDGSLYYGIVANNATGYDLIKLQSGSNPVTRFSVDALGNTDIGGQLSVNNDILTDDTIRLTSDGSLTNITGYSQSSGNFSITQSEGDTATINKNHKALSDLLTLTLDERNKGNSIYSTLTLKRYDGANEAAALYVDEGSAIFDHQLQLGRFATNPDTIGQGSLVFNTTDTSLYIWNGSSWVNLGGGSIAGFWQQISGVLSPQTTTDDLAIGGTDSTAPFYVDDSGNVTIDGQCVTGDTLLPIVSGEQGSDPDKIDYVQIRDIQGGELVYSLNQQTEKIEPHKIKGLLNMGIKPVFKLTTKDGRTIRTTGNHPYLARSTGGLTGRIFVYNIEHQQSINNSKNSQSQEKIENRVVHNLNLLDKNQLDPQKISVNSKLDSTRNIPPLSTKSDANNDAKDTSPALSPISENTLYSDLENRNSLPIQQNLNSTSETVSNAKWTKVIYLKPGDEIAVASEDLLLSQKDTITSHDIGWQQIVSIEYVGEEQVYDIEVEGTHNFVANGIIAHNTTIGDAGDTITLSGTTISLTSNSSGNDISLISADDIILNDTQLTSAVQLSVTDNALPNNNTGLVDAINDAWNAATGGSGSLWTRTGTTLSPTSAADQLILGGVGTESTHALEVRGAKIGQALVVFDETGDQDILVASSSGTAVFTLGHTGDLLLKPTTDSTTTFQVQKSNTTPVFNVDTTNGRVGIGTATPTHPLTVSTTDQAVLALHRNTNTDEDTLDLVFQFNNADGDTVDYGMIRSKNKIQTAGIEKSYLSFHAVRAGTMTEYIRFSEIGMEFNAIGTSWIDTRFESDHITSMLYINAGTDTITIGSEMELAFFGIDGYADEVQLTVQAHSSQTANILEIQKSDTSVLAGFDERGILFSDGGIDVNSVFIGSDAGRTAASGAVSNTGLGSGTLAGLTSGDNNIAVGRSALNDLTSGLRNVAVGNYALELLSTDNENVAVGYTALTANAGGSQNSAIGYLALGANTTGDNNMAVGSQSLRFTETGSGNTAIGHQAGQGTSGSSFSNNTFIGYQTALDLTTGSSNIFLGAYAGDKQTTLSDRLIIDNQTRTDAPEELTNSILYGVMASTPATQSLRVNADLYIGGSNMELRFYEGTNYVGFEAPALTGDQIWVLPDEDATDANQVLASDASGGLSWIDVTSGSGSLWKHLDHYLYPTEYWADDLIIGGNSTSSATFQVFAGSGGAEIDLGSDSVGLTIQGDASQTANILEIQKSDTTVQFAIDGIGAIDQDIVSSDHTKSLYNSFGIDLALGTNFTTAQNYGSNFQVNATNTVLVSRTLTGSRGFATQADGSTANWSGTIRGGVFRAQTGSTSSVYLANAIGGEFEVVSLANRSSWINTSAIAGKFTVSLQSDTAHTTANAYSLFVPTHVKNANITITNSYGLYVEDINVAGTGNYSIYTNAGDVIFNAGNDASTQVGIGDTTPDGLLDVEPTGAVTAASYGINLSNLTTNAATDGINKYGAYITSTGTWTAGEGTETNNYGLYVDTVSGADNNYGAYFADNVGIGTSTPSQKLDVAGKIAVGSFSSPIDVTGTREYGAEIHYSGNAYNVTALRARSQLITTDSAAVSMGALIQGANTNDTNAGTVRGALIEAIGKSDANSSTIGNLEGLVVNTEWNAKEIITNLKTAHIRTHTRDSETEGYFTGTGYLLYLENEAVGGNGQELDAGLFLKATNVSTPYAFDYGIDLSGAAGEIATADIRFSGGTTLAAPDDITLNFANATDTFIVKGASSQTANLQEWQDSNGALLAAVDGSGNFGIGKATLATRAIDILKAGNTHNSSAINVSFKATGNYYRLHGIKVILRLAGDNSYTSGDNLPIAFDGVVSNLKNDGTINAAASFNAHLAFGNVYSTTLNKWVAYNLTNDAIYANADVENVYGLYFPDLDFGSVSNYSIYTNAGSNMFNAGGDADTDFQVNASGVTGALFLDGTNGYVGLGDTDPVANLVIGDDTNAGFANGAGDVYIQNDLEVDGTIYGTLSGGSSSAWDDLTLPDNDLSLTMGAFNTTFAWDPTVDSAETAFSLTFDGEDTASGGDEDQVLLALSQTSNGQDVVEAADALLTLTNSDANDPVENAIRFDAGGAGTDFTYGINFDGASIETAEIVLQNAEQILNTIDTEIAFSDGTNTLTIDLDEDSGNTIDFTTSSGDDITFNPVSGNVGIGTTTPGNLLTITNPTTGDALADVMIGTTATTQKGLVIQGLSSQTANLQEWQDSGANVLSGVDERGILFSDGNIDSASVFIGQDAGNSAASGAVNNFGIGNAALASLTSGDNNVIIGGQAGDAITEGGSNLGLGTFSLSNMTTANNNVGVGYATLLDVVDGDDNVAIGRDALRNVSNSSATNNVAIGYQAGMNATNSNVFIGYQAGKNQTGSNLFIIDNQTRTDVTEELTNSILYGVMANAPTSQTLRVNAKLDVYGDMAQAYTFTNATGDEEAFKITSTDSVAQSANMHRSLVVSHAVTAAKTGTASVEGISSDIALSADTFSVYGYGAYISESGNNTHGNIFGMDIYLEDMGSGGIANLVGLNIGINSTNTASSRHTGLRIRNHSGTATDAILVESAFVDGIDFSGGTFSGAEIRLTNGSTIGGSLGNVFNSALTINTNSTAALLVEQDGVNDNVLVVDTTNGRVGIGTDIPDALLHVAGDIFLDDGVTTSPQIKFISGDNDNLRLYLADNSIFTRQAFTSDGKFIETYDIRDIDGAGADGNTVENLIKMEQNPTGIRSIGSQLWKFDDATQDAGSSSWRIKTLINNVFQERIIIDSSGNVGIGTAFVSPLARLHVKGSTDNQQLIVQANSSQAANTFELQNSSSVVLASFTGFDSTSAFQVNKADTTNVFNVDTTNGRVGIGDSDPDNLLEILSSGAANTQLSIGNTNAGNYDVQIGFELADGTNTFTMGVDESDGSKFKISTTALGTNDRFVIDSSGYIGINQTTPTAQLHIGSGSETHTLDADDVLISSDLELDGILYLDGGQIAGAYGPGTVQIAFAVDPVNNENSLGVSSWLIENTTNTELAALMVDQNNAYGNALFTASASGVTKFTINNEGSITLATDIADASVTTEGTIFYDNDSAGSSATDHLFLRGSDSNWHRIALDMTKYSGNNASIADGSYLEVAHNQGTNDLMASGWIYDGAKYFEIDDLAATALNTTDSRLVAWYKAEEASGNLDNAEGTAYHDLTATGSATYQQTGKVNYAIDLDGTNDWFVSKNDADNDSMDFGTGSFSIGGWFKHDTIATNSDYAITKYSDSAAIDTGTGADGAIEISADTNINTDDSILGRECDDGGDAINYSVSSLTSTTAVLTTTPSTGCIVADDEILLINLQGGSAANSNVGNYEALKVESVSGTTVTFASSKTNYYGSGASDDNNIGTATGEQRVMLQRVPNYTNVIINTGKNFTPSDWNGTKNGVMFFRASGTVSIDGTGTIRANGAGYKGGTGAANVYTRSKAGESVFDTGGTDGDGGADSANDGVAGLFSGGGGGGCDFDGPNCGNGAAGTSSYPAGGGGGGGGGGRRNGSNGLGAGGGGGGYSAGGNGGSGINNGTNGTTNASGAGGNAELSSGTYYAGGGGGGAGNYGAVALPKLFLGSGGAGGGAGRTNSATVYAGGSGAAGGGIVVIAGATITVNGGVTSTGDTAASSGSYRGGCGGSGSGGSIKLLGETVTMGATKVTASGGTAQTTTCNYGGGKGGTGRIAVEYTTGVSGSTTPTYNGTQVQASSGGYKLYMDADGDYVFGIDDDPTSFPEDTATTTAVNHDDNNWHHVVGVKYGTDSIRLYIDGQEVGSDYSLSASSSISNSNPFYLGVDEDGSSNPWDGLFDQIFIYGRALSPGEIEELYRSNSRFQIEQTDTNTVRLYNYSGATQNLRLDIAVFGADLAEWYTVEDDSIGPGDVVALIDRLDPYGVPVLKKAIRGDRGRIIGAISTQAGKTLGIGAENRRLLGLSGRIPVKMDPQSPSIEAGNFITASPNKPGFAYKASVTDIAIGKALSAWSKPEDETETTTVLMLILDPQMTFTASADDLKDLVINKLEDGYYEVLNSIDEHVIEPAGAFASIIAANIKAGFIETKEFTTESLTAFEATVDDLLITNGLVSPEIKTDLISPLADGNIDIQIGSPEATEEGKLAILNRDGEEVASIDESGDATFSGHLTTNSIQTTDIESDEITAGKIYADEIVVNKQSILNNDLSEVTLEEIEALLKEAEEEQKMLAEAKDWSTAAATSSTTINNQQLTTSNLFVTETAAINMLSVTESLAVGSDLVIQSSLSTTHNIPTTSINTLSAPLQIQSLALAPIEIMAGLVKIDTEGNVMIQGNLFVAGTIESGGLSIKDLDDNEVANINASGSANFETLTTDKLIIAGGEEENADSSIVGSTIKTNATAGKATISAGKEEIIIQNPKVTDYSLVYVTPQSSTQNKVLYVKKKESCQLTVEDCTPYFIVGFNQAIEIDVDFNWWIIEAKTNVNN